MHGDVISNLAWCEAQMCGDARGRSGRRGMEPVRRALLAGLLTLGLVFGLAGCGAPPAPVSAAPPAATSPGPKAPSGVANAPRSTTAPGPMRLAVVYTNDTWGYLTPCG